MQKTVYTNILNYQLNIILACFHLIKFKDVLEKYQKTVLSSIMSLCEKLEQDSSYITDFNQKSKDMIFLLYPTFGPKIHEMHGPIIHEQHGPKIHKKYSSEMHE